MSNMRNLHHPAKNEITLSAVLYALSDPIRLQIVKQLINNTEISCIIISGVILGKEMPKSTLSHHFKALREAGITRTRIEKTQRFISLRQDDLEARFPGLIQALLDATKPLY